MKRLCFLILLILASCSQEEVFTNGDAHIGKKTNSISGVGEMHNNFMDYIANDFVINSNIETKDDAFNYVTTFFKEKTDLYSKIVYGTKENIKEGFEENIYLLESLELHSIIKNEKLIDNPIRKSETNLEILLNDLKNENIISIDEYSKLKDFQVVLSEVFVGNLNIQELKNHTRNLKMNYNSDEIIINNMIEIMDFSSEWWTTNNPSGYFPLVGVIEPNDSNYSDYTPMWIANDVAGALIGGVGSAGIQYVLNGEVDWAMVGAVTLTGAIIGSTGAVGKLGGWIRGLF